MIIDYGYGDREFCLGLGAMVEYEQQFRSDIVKDLFGKGRVVPEDPGEPDDGEAFSFDFTQTNWTACAKALWAGEKAVDPAAPGFSEWCRLRPNPDMSVVSDAVMREAAEAFFRAGVSASA